MFCAKSELCIFEPSAVQVVAQDGMWCDIHPSSTLEKANSLQFVISGSSQDYLDLNDTTLYIKAKYVGKNGGALTKDQVTIAPCNYLLHGLFDDVIVYLNDVKIEGGSRLYAYKAVIQNELNFSDETKGLQLAPAGYETDENDRKKWTNSNIELMGALNVDFFQTQPKYMLPGVNVRIELNRSKEGFYSIVSSAQQPRIEIIKAILYVRRVRCASAVLVGHEAGLSKRNAIYPYQKCEMVTHTIAAGSQSLVQENIFRGLMPKMVIVTMVKGSAFTGTYKDDPFKFEPFGVNFVGLFRDGQALPYRTSYTPNFAAENPSYIREYFISIIQNLEFMRKNANNGITAEEFATGGRCYFTFNLTPDFCVNQTQPPKDANLRLDLKFDAALAESINVLILGIFDAEIQITKQRRVLIQ